MKKFLAFLLAAVMATALLAGCGAQKGGTVATDGSTSMEKVIGAIGEAFTTANPNVKFTYNPTGSGSGITAIAEGRCDIGLSSRALKDEEKAKGLTETTLALDGIAIIVNPANTVKGLTLQQLSDIYTGKITNWKDVGGPDMKIVVVNRDEASGTYGSFIDIFLKPFYKGDYFTKNAIVTKENGEVAAKVTATPGAIGYVGIAFADQVVKAGGRELMVDGVAPTVANVIARKYAGSRYLYLVTKGQPVAGSVEKAFIDFVLSPKGQAIVKAADFIPLPKK